MPEGGVNIFAHTMAFFNKPEARGGIEDFADFGLINGVLLQKFLHNVFEPNEAGDLQRCASFKGASLAVALYHPPQPRQAARNLRRDDDSGEALSSDALKIAEPLPLDDVKAVRPDGQLAVGELMPPLDMHGVAPESVAPDDFDFDRIMHRCKSLAEYPLTKRECRYDIISVSEVQHEPDRTHHD